MLEMVRDVVALPGGETHGRGGREVAGKDVAVFTREPVATGPGSPFCPWGRRQPKWAGLGCPPRKASANLLCACSGTQGAGQ